MKSVLITGSSGLIGSEWAAYFGRLGCHSGAVVERIKAYGVRSYIPEKKPKGAADLRYEAKSLASEQSLCIDVPSSR